MLSSSHSTQLISDRLVHATARAGLAAIGSSVGVAIADATGFMPDILNTPLRAAFFVAAYSAAQGIAAYRTFDGKKPPAHTPS